LNSELQNSVDRFTEENFALLIAMIFIVKAVENIGHIGEHYPINPSGADVTKLFRAQKSF
jgi:hypothetical protein